MNAKKIINRVAGLSLGLALVPMTAPAFAADSDYFQVPTSGPASLTEPLPEMPPAVSEAALVADAAAVAPTKASENGVKAGVAPVNVQAKSAGFELSSPAIALGLVLGLALVAGSVLALRKVRH